MNKKDYIILVDLDDTIEDLLTAWVNYLNKVYDTNVDSEEITDWKISNFFPELTSEQLYEPLVDPELWKTVRPIPGAVKYLRKLIEEGFTVRICTASSPTSYALKMKHFVKRYLPFIDTRLHCLCAHDKQLIKGNILLDDNFENLLGGSYKGILFNRKHNEKYPNPSNLIRVDSWEEFYNIVEKEYQTIEN